MTPTQLKEIRASKRMNQKEFSDFLGPGASYSALTKWETGKNPIPQWVIDKLRPTSGKFILKDLSVAEAMELERVAASKGVSPDSLVADLVRAALKFSVPLLVALHAVRAGAAWSPESMLATIRLAGNFVVGLFS